MPMRKVNPYDHPGVRRKAKDIMEDITSVMREVNDAGDRYGWTDPYVLDGLAVIQKWQRYQEHLLDMLKSA